MKNLSGVLHGESVGCISHLSRALAESDFRRQFRTEGSPVLRTNRSRAVILECDKRCVSESPLDLFTIDFGGSYNWAGIVICMLYSREWCLIILPHACVLFFCQMKVHTIKPHVCVPTFGDRKLVSNRIKIRPRHPGLSTITFQW